jgi:hypothetical protein
LADATATRTRMADRNINPAPVSGRHIMEFTLNAINRQVAAEDVYDALVAKFGAAGALTTALAGANNDITYTARDKGTVGNAITVRYVVAGLGTALSVAVVGTAITVNVATDGGGLATSTASDVLAAVQAHAAASLLVSAALAAGNSGAGVVTALAATALAGGDQKVTSAHLGGSHNNFNLEIR